MSEKRKKKPSDSKVSEPKVAQSYRLHAAKIAAARRVLGVPTATAAIEMALDMVVFRQELIDGLRAARGITITPFDDERA